MRSLLTHIIVVLATGLASALPTAAFAEESPPDGAVAIVQETMEEVIRILEDQTYSSLRKNEQLNDRQIELRETYRQQIRDLLIARLDIERVADLTLARERGKFSAAQRKRFEKLFADLLFSTYIQHLEKYTGQSLEVMGTKKVSPKPTDSRVWVQTIASSNGRETPIDYCLYSTDNTWKIYDVNIEGLSLVQNYRGQFREVLVKEKTGQPLLDRIEKRLEENRIGQTSGSES